MHSKITLYRHVLTLFFSKYYLASPCFVTSARIDQLFQLRFYFYLFACSLLAMIDKSREYKNKLQSKWWLSLCEKQVTMYFCAIIKKCDDEWKWKACNNSISFKLQHESSNVVISIFRCEQNMNKRSLLALIFLTHSLARSLSLSHFRLLGDESSWRRRKLFKNKQDINAELFSHISDTTRHWNHPWYFLVSLYFFNGRERKIKKLKLHA